MSEAKRYIGKITLVVLAIILSANTDRRDMFINPVEIPVSISANFGELRPDHFHSGIDIKTNGVTGHKVLAADNGHIYRISVSPSGFGKALYIRHNNGFSTVYGHLDRFIPDIDKYVKEEQYRKEDFAIELYPQKDKFPVSRGDIIAFSGNSGSSMGPHLHFEVRRSSNENPVDPLSYIELADEIRPVIDRIFIYPLSRNSMVNGYNEKVKFRLTGDKGNYSLSSPTPVMVSGDIGIGISTWDFLNNSWNKCGVRSVEMKLDGRTRYRHSIDEFAFSESRYINSHIDYEEQQRSGTWIQKTFLEPNNRLSIYELTENSGIIRLSDNEMHKVELIVTDYAGNNSRVTFLVAADNNSSLDNSPPEPSREIPYSEAAVFNRHDIKVSFPRDCFYDTLRFIYKKSPSEQGLLSDLHYLHNRFTPVHKTFDLSIKPFDLPRELDKYLCLVYVKEGSVSYAGGIMADGFVTGKVRALGNYAVGIDSVPPQVRALNFSDRSDIQGKSDLRIFLDDEFSGVASYEVTIDGNWALFEWDPKNRVISYKPDNSIKNGGLHKLVAVVSDNLGNKTNMEISFLW